MAKIGFRHFYFAPFSGEEPENGLPSYGERKKIGRAISADWSPEYAEGELYADDEVAESDKEFVKGTLNAVVDDMLENVQAAIYGATLSESGNGVKHGADDNPPMGGITFIRAMKRNNVKYYEGNFMPKVKATPGNSSAATKASGFTYQTTNLNMSYYAARDEKHTYHDIEVFETEAEAVAWCEGKLSASAS